jgi:hypothetical protein
MIGQEINDFWAPGNQQGISLHGADLGVLPGQGGNLMGCQRFPDLGGAVGAFMQ